MYCILWKIHDVHHSNLCRDLSIQNILISQTITERQRILVFVKSESHQLAFSYRDKYFNFVVNTVETKGILPVTTGNNCLVCNMCFAIQQASSYTVTSQWNLVLAAHLVICMKYR